MGRGSTAAISCFVRRAKGASENQALDTRPRILMTSPALESCHCRTRECASGRRLFCGLHESSLRADERRSRQGLSPSCMATPSDHRTLCRQDYSLATLLYAQVEVLTGCVRQGYVGD